MTMWRLVSGKGDTRDVSTYAEAVAVATAVHNELGIGSEVWLVENGSETLVTWVPFTTTAS
jgi:hypothetical protein